MKNYINKNNEIYSYEDNVAEEFLEEKIVELELIVISDEDLAILLMPTVEESSLQAKDVNNNPIYQQLEELDKKSIRALRTNDTQRMAEIEAEATILRSKLL